VTELTHVVEALLFVASEPLSVSDLAAAAEAPPERVERALDALSERYAEGRSGLVLERVSGGYGLRASRATADACTRLMARAPDRNLSPAALETLAVIAYLQPVGRPEVARIRGVSADGAVATLVERGLVEEAGRDEGGGAVLYRTTGAFERVFALAEGLSDLPPLPDLGETETGDLRARLHAVAAERDGVA
jgi:segregation and condensation protein B